MSIWGPGMPQEPDLDEPPHEPTREEREGVHGSHKVTMRQCLRLDGSSRNTCARSIAIYRIQTG